ncbi:MAG: hypothetical protein WCV90_05930 [Candidatus Woesearchaeota archaeon]
MTDGLQIYSVSIEYLEGYFSNFTTDQLERYNRSNHGITITSKVENGYLRLLSKAIEGGVYPTTNPHFSGRVGGRMNYWDHGKRRRMNCIPIPIDVLGDLQEESGLVVTVLDSFKKLNWALQVKITPESGAPDLGKGVDYRVNQLHQSLLAISGFHGSEKKRPFILEPPNVDADYSDYLRSRLYDFVSEALGLK